ncbi:hypothetical protein [Oryza sativa Japonica Group]|jgi:hypothetical protein|uniref:Uncharacterized protein n=1 Tax=Oryza sativa subsp. japonica TaxID=39947 RepID=Q5NBT0_ORYSJ|nr:hypothetical protein [Oryza sativa Japonica Group]BAE95795.1 hypothetical protein [Oryza sativa Japonica Group]
MWRRHRGDWTAQSATSRRPRVEVDGDGIEAGVRRGVDVVLEVDGSELGAGVRKEEKKVVWC